MINFSYECMIKDLLKLTKGVSLLVLGLLLLPQTGCVQSHQAGLFTQERDSQKMGKVLRATPVDLVGDHLREHYAPHISTAPDVPGDNVTEIWDTHLGDNLPVIHGRMSLEQCVQKAMEVNRKRPASALLLWRLPTPSIDRPWPPIGPRWIFGDQPPLRSTDMNYIVPPQQFQLPATTIGVPASTFSLPASSIPNSLRCSSGSSSEYTDSRPAISGSFSDFSIFRLKKLRYWIAG